MSEKVGAAKKAALWGMCIADALSLPVHWYYTTSDIKKGYNGWLTGFVTSNKHNPSSYYTRSSLGNTGKKDKDGKPETVIGNVILHDKLSLWMHEDKQLHYHQNMKSGDNTLNAIWALQILKTLHRIDPDNTVSDRDLRAAVLEDYVQFMITPGTHNDSYAETFHRLFFGDWAGLENPPRTGSEILKFAEERSQKLVWAPDHSFPTIGALVPATAWILHTAQKSEAECVQTTREFVKLTHPAADLLPFADMYAKLLHAVINGSDLKSEVMKYLSHSALGGQKVQEKVLELLEKAQSFEKGSEERVLADQSAIKEFGMACSIKGAFTGVLYLALQYADDFDGGVLANANCGGENVHRSSPLGALLAANVTNHGQTISQKWKDGLCSAKAYLLKTS